MSQVSSVFSVPLSGDCPAMLESVGITVGYVMCPTEKDVDSSFDQTMIPLVPYQSPCNGWLCYHAYAPAPTTYPANAQTTHLDSLQ